MFWRKKKKDTTASGDLPESPQEVPISVPETAPERPAEVPVEPDVPQEAPVETPPPEIEPPPEPKREDPAPMPMPAPEDPPPEEEPTPVPVPEPEQPEIEPVREPVPMPAPPQEPEIEPIPDQPAPEEETGVVSLSTQSAEEDKGKGTGGSWLGRLSKGLSKSSSKIGQGLADLVTKRKLDQNMLDELEELLIMADLGPKTAAHIVGTFGADRFGKDISETEIKDLLAGSISKILSPVAQTMAFAKVDGKPMVVIVCGVNGVGKTTTIGKIAYDLSVKQGMKITLGAGDTFRAAAVEQLEIWAQRANTGFVKKDLGADAAALAYEAYEKAKADNADVLFIDTAGRLHNKANLMAELEKIIRVLKKHDENLPHAVLLVLDATTGQNAHAQVETFKQMVNVTGLAVTKLDGSAKGGVVVSLADHFGLPIHYIGVGETAEDLRPFAADDFARSLVGSV